ncbi:uncharacterized protein BX663DRAFT_549208 [Cokeromyces recurvatus]|uniref:uncharacterized protein n=1 Tax=Cokeromyces recurvatus TaxID=90255 RepID=UPI0022208AED|nr:uncharacterized protein BX663DRAFT_549208 [Cokeromyces recurvatus]KAI7906095.1 hypothetical protein BX663DRAFT_549208 [Cokeromyces recurvatus]
MLKNSTWKLEETNLANFGSELERQHRKEEGALETAWNYEGSPIGHETGLWVWRVQNFNLVAVPSSQYGKFYQGDSYIILKSFKKENRESLTHHIHFWLGLETSQDEAGTAAYKTVELDDYLDTIATQYREVQYRESRLFSSYFKSIIYLQGGFASGFHHVEEEEEFPTRLLRVHRPKHLEGTRTRNAVVISEVLLSYQSLRSTAVFILDTGDLIYQWQGEACQGIEKAKAAEFISQLISERHGKGDMIIVEQNTSGEHDFFDALGSNGPIVEKDENEEEEEEEQVQIKKLLRLSSSGPFGMGHLKFEMVAEESRITKDMFDTHDVFIFDVGHQVYVWIGHKASRKERKHGLEYAQNYITESNRSSFTPICQVIEGGEDELFESNVEGWQGW